MTYESNAAEVEQDAIPELYVITGGGYQWHYTSNETDLTFLGEIYKAASIKRSSFTGSSQPGESKVTLTFPVIDPIITYLSSYPMPSTAVQIYRATRSTLSNYVLLFDGKIKRVSAVGRVISADCFVDDELSAMLPNIVYQSYCNWALFDCGCGLSVSDYEVAAVVTVGGSSLTSPTFSTFAKDYFTQGRIRFGGDFRFITGHDGAQVDLQIPFGSELTTGLTVYAVPGCDGAPATCRTKFNNFDTRHVSMPYIPSHNPVVWGFK
jgi:uncharacterized phage protein (TIGR02218 family)